MDRIVLAAPGKNALSIAVLEGIRRDVEATRGEPFVLTGAGDVFCAGLNLKELATLDGAGVRRRSPRSCVSGRCRRRGAAPWRR
jgi:enoyl-CoA hydratase/carnithine racemase